MFEFIRGTLYSKGSDYCVIDVSGIGYRISTSLSTISSIGQIGEIIMVHTYLHVKEDGIALFGFSTHEELSVFLMLISVSGVGPKGALAILCTLTPSQFSLAVVTSDFKTISRSKGVGPKLAQRIILDLKDKIKKDTMLTNSCTDVNFDADSLNGVIDAENEAVLALIVLGYSAKEASKAVALVSEDGLSLEDILKLALKRLMR